MKILWCVNIMLPDICAELNLKINPFGGWMESLLKDLSAKENIEIAVGAVYNGKTIEKYVINNVTYYLLPIRKNDIRKMSKKYMCKLWKTLINEFKPDIIHIHGTEFSHGLALQMASQNIPVVVSIQGLLSEIKKNYYIGMSFKDIFLNITLRDILKHEFLFLEKYSRNTKSEMQLLKSVKYIIGRTDFDFSHCMSINPALKYFFCNDSLRPPFYKQHWDINNKENHTILMSEATYPIKGLHIALKALFEVKRHYPNAKLKIAGYNIIDKSTLKNRLKRYGYALFIEKLIKKLNLTDNVTFLGILNEDEMADNMKKSHVLILPSTCENGSNTLGEAQLIGLPTVASFVGGLPNSINHKQSGFLFPLNDHVMLSRYIIEIFGDDELALKFSKNAKVKAQKRHSLAENTENMINIYNKILKKDD